jgi:uridine monophosphate synthetase
VKNTNDKINLALKLVDIGAVKFGNFRLKLHDKNPDAPLSPIYINLRLLKSFPHVMVGAVNEYILTIKKFKFDILADIPTAATPIVSIISYKTKLPMISVRKEEKSHGVQGQIDGKYEVGQKVILIDDLITKADSKFEAIDILKDHGLLISGIVVLIDREQGGVDELKERGYKCVSVYKLNWLLNLYLKKSKINKQDYDRTLQYIKKL